MIEEELKSKEQFCIVKETGTLMIIRDNQRINKSKEHKLVIRNATASIAAV